MAGTIFIKPSEISGFAGYTGSAKIIVPATGQVYNPRTRTFGGGGVVITDPAKYVAQQQAIAKAKREALAREEAKKKAEVERRRIEELQRESIRKKGLEQKRYNELIRLKQRQRIRERREWSSLSEGEKRRLREEDEVRRLEKLRGKDVKLTPKLEKVRERIRERGAKEIRVVEDIKKKVPVNIFSRKSWREFGESLSRSRLQRDRNLGKKILTEPLSFTSMFIRRTLEMQDLPAGLLALIKNPKNIKKIPENFIEDAKGTVQLLKTNPTAGIGKIGADIFTFKIIGGTIKATGKIISPVATKLSPKFAKVVKGKSITIPSKQVGKTLTIKISPKIGRARIPTPFIGKRPVVVSAQANRLVKIIKTRKIIRKPIPGEAKLTKVTKKLLKKFDKGKITPKELIQLDKRVSKEAKKGLLERSFFADPEGVVRKRFLRLGTEKEASLRDVLSGDVTFKTSKPQILIFEDVKVQAFPKTKIFDAVKKKLKVGKTLTLKESEALVKFQLKKTGKFKPLGFQTREIEITLAPGEIIKKQKTVAVTLIDGKRVPIVRATVVKAKPLTKKLLSKARKGKINAKELKILRKNLKKETGFTSSISDSYISKSRYPLGRKSLSIAIKPRTRRLPKRIPKRPPKRIPKRPPKRIPKRIPKIKPKVIVRRRPLARPRVGKPLIKPPIKIPRIKKKKIKVKKRRARSYHVYARPLRKKGRKKPKLIRVTKRPIKKKKAEDLRNYITDTSLSRTAGLKGSRRKPSKRTLKAPTGYASKTQKKFRKFKIVKGKKIPLRKWRVIERKKHLLDTRQEKRQITLRKRIAQMQKQARKNPVRRITTIPNKRKSSPAQLAALAKGRATRMKNLRKR